MKHINLYIFKIKIITYIEYSRGDYLFGCIIIKHCIKSNGDVRYRVKVIE